MGNIFKIESTLENLCKCMSRTGDRTIVYKKHGNNARANLISIGDLTKMIREGTNVYFVGEGDDRKGMYTKFFNTSIIIADTEEEAKVMFQKIHGPGDDGEEDHTTITVISKIQVVDSVQQK